MNRTLVLILILVSSVAKAIGPDLPLQFEEDQFTARSWITTIRIDPSKVDRPRVTREIFRSGERLSTEPVRPKQATTAKEQSPRIEVPLRPAATTHLDPGVYAMRITVEGHWLNHPASDVLHIERWYYFKVQGKELVRLTAEEHERLSDPPREPQGAGGRNRFYLGGDRIGAVPLSKTEHHQAVRADSVRADGAIIAPEEQVPLPPASKTYTPKERPPAADKSEVKEP